MLFSSIVPSPGSDIRPFDSPNGVPTRGLGDRESDPWEPRGAVRQPASAKPRIPAPVLSRPSGGVADANSVARQMSGFRLDISEVPLQGAYVAKRCPVRAQSDVDQSLAGQALALSPMQRARANDGNAFEAEIFTELLSTHGPAAVEISAAGLPGAMKAATVHATESGAELILGGWLPDDTTSRRTGRPDVLVRRGAGYLPVDVKHHALTNSTDEPLSAWRLQELTSGAPALEAEGTAWRRGRLLEDALQLAHYWRLLESSGLVPHGVSAVGGIVDRTRRVWWIALDAPRWSVWWSDSPVSVLERYDHEFAFRLDIIAHTLARNDDPALEPKVDPVRIAECPQCPWWEVCLGVLQAEDHVSLLPRSTWFTFVEHRRRGVLTRHAVADLDWATAWVIHGNRGDGRRVDVADLLERASGVESIEDIAAVTGDDKTAQGRLDALGIAKVGELVRLDVRTASYSNARVGWLPGLIDEATAASRGVPHRARDVTVVSVPRADLEIDLDMENTEDGVYLWGTLATVVGQPLGATDVRYRAFADWVPLTPEREALLLARFWTWLQELRQQAYEAGRTVRIYSYTSAERSQLNRIAEHSSGTPGVPSPDEIGELVNSDCWVDLHEVFTSQIVTGESASLKVTARYAGFRWRDPDAGGDASMLWYQEATTAEDAEARLAARVRLLTYNEDDVLATAALRTWLSDKGDQLPSLNGN
jgi:predicted RecB family nuclease